MTASLSSSIIVPVRNGAETIGDMLTALFNQADAPPEKEVIVVDNGSTDATRDIVNRFDVTLLEETTPGVSSARNRGLSHAGGDIYINIDADTLPTRYWLREMIAPFSDPEVILVGGKIMSFRPETGAERYIEQAGLYAPDNSVANPDLPFVTGGNLAVRREAALAIGGWAEDLIRSEDIDFSYRITHQLSTRIRYQPSALIFHRNRRTDNDLKKQARGYGYGAALIYKRYPEQIKWRIAHAMKLAVLLAHRTAMPALYKIGHRFGRVTNAELEFAKYHRMWTWSFWHIFLRTYYLGHMRKSVP